MCNVWFDHSEACGGSNIFFDGSTSLSRAETQIECSMDVTTCVRPTHPIYSVQLQRYLCAREYLGVQGIWRIDSENVAAFDNMVRNEKLAQDLAGNAMSSTVAQAVFLASLVACDAVRDVELQNTVQSPSTCKRQKLDEPAALADLTDASHSTDKACVGVSQTTNATRVQTSNAAAVSQLVVPTRRLRAKTTLRHAQPAKKKSSERLGNKKATGKKPSATIYQKECIMAAFDEAVSKGVKNPVKSVSGMTGYFKGCTSDSKWPKLRGPQQWTLLAQTAPELMKKHREIPNSLRRVIGMSAMKHNITSCDPSSVEQIHLPLPLQTVVEDLVMDRIVIGEEVTIQYVKSVIVFASELWNEVVGSMRHVLKDRSLALLREQDHELSQLTQAQLDLRMAEMVKTTEGLLRPIRIAENDGTLLLLGSTWVQLLSYIYIYIYICVLFNLCTIYIYCTMLFNMFHRCKDTHTG